MCYTETHKSDTKWHKMTSGWHEMTNFMWRILVCVSCSYFEVHRHRGVQCLPFFQLCFGLPHLLSAGLHAAADDAEGQRSGSLTGLLHSNPGNDVIPQSDPKLLPCCSAFTFYSLGYEDKVDTPADVKERTVWTFSRRATLELTQYVWKQPVQQLNSIWVLFIINNIPPPVSNWGTESDADLSYHNGNNEPWGFGENLFVQRSDRFVCFSMLDLLWLSLLSRFHAGHIGIAVPDVYAACKLFEEQGVRFVKKPETGEFFSQRSSLKTPP